MTINTTPQTNDVAQHNTLKYALTDGIVRGRKGASSMRAMFIISAVVLVLAAFPALFAVWRYIYDTPWRKAVEWQSFESLLAAIAIVAIVVIGGVHLLARITHTVANRRVQNSLSSDPLVTRIASDFSVPENLVLEAVNRMVRSDVAGSDFTHGRDKIKLKITTKRDDVLGRNVDFLKVSKERAISVTDDLIVA
jgi:hypothetical protein